MAMYPNGNPYCVEFMSVIYGTTSQRFFKTKKAAEEYRAKIEAQRVKFKERLNSPVTIRPTINQRG